jgi:hypothetical protein
VWGILELVIEPVESHLPICACRYPSCLEADIWTVLEPLTCTGLILHDERGQKKDMMDYVRLCRLLGQKDEEMSRGKTNR